MPRLLAVLSLLAVLALANSCGYVAVRGAINPGMQVAAGMVSIVQFSFSNGTSSLTIVTLVDNGTANTFSFCGDQRSQFPMDQTVNASFTPGMTCSTLIAVTIN